MWDTMKGFITANKFNWTGGKKNHLGCNSCYLPVKVKGGKFNGVGFLSRKTKKSRNKSALESNYFRGEEVCLLNIPSSVWTTWREDYTYLCLILQVQRLTGLKHWVTELQSRGGKRRITTGGGTAGGGGEKKEWNNPVVRAPRESVRGKREGVGYPACRQNGTGEGAAAFLLALQEPERPRNILRERPRSGAPIHRLLSWPRGRSPPRPHPEVLQLQWNPPGLWPWPLTDVVWRKSQRDGPQGERRVQQTRWEHVTF